LALRRSRSRAAREAERCHAAGIQLSDRLSDAVRLIGMDAWHHTYRYQGLIGPAGDAIMRKSLIA
jgi:hypothetical protein